MIIQQSENTSVEDAIINFERLISLAGAEGGGHPELVVLVLFDRQQLHICAAYQATLFQPKTIEVFLNVFRRILNLTPIEPHMLLSTLPLTTGSDLQQLAAWNPQANYESLSNECSVGARFRETAKRKGSAVAIVDGSWSISYDELDEMTDRLASWLHAKNLGEERIIGVVSFAYLLENLT